MNKQSLSEHKDQSKDISAPSKLLTSCINTAKHKPFKSQPTNEAGLLVTRISLVTSGKRQDLQSGS
ncbi:hypothetical protein PCASD_18654 [Puccinia coronata f. sp. avenae]|uniref:Uncharacterized protein n=1 Tax=Puccinia coronata f. sp. avenae TaxID=200324 RepID=A0A2N5UF34_9BASI|nr:hypothetical protein PCASD_18654 [Puccinia coronata f. sp. avenae]